MEYLQYIQNREDILKKEGVLNLIINGIPSIQASTDETAIIQEPF